MLNTKGALWIAAKGKVRPYEIWELLRWLEIYKYILPADRVARTKFITAMIQWCYPENVPFAGATHISMIAEQLTQEEQKGIEEWLTKNSKN